MKTHSLKRALAIALCASLPLAALAGCGSETFSSTPSSETAQSSATSQTGTEADPADPWAEKVTLSIATPNSPNVEDFDTNWFTTYLEEEANIDIEFTLLPTDGTEAKTKLNLMVSSGEELPDIIDMGLDSVTYSDYGSKGVFVDTSNYFADPEMMPNYFEYVDEETRAFIEKCMKASDGKVYGFPKYAPQYWNEASYRCWINVGWLDKVGKEMPTTTDELYDVLKAFVESDPNGNGKADEIGMVGGSGWNQDPTPFLMNAFLYANPDYGYFDTKDGKIIASFTQPEWRDGLEYMNKLVNEGLLDPLSFTQDGTQLKSLINVEGGMAGVVPSGSVTAFDYEILGDPAVDGTGMTLMPPLKGPEGHASTPQIPTTPSQTWFITKDCDNVDRAVRVADLFMRPDVYTMGENGEPEVDWSMDPATMEEYTLTPYEIEKGMEAWVVIMNPIWGQVQNKSWQGAHPGYFKYPEKAVKMSIRKDSEEANINSYTPNADHEEMYGGVFRPTDELIVKFSYTEEESQQLADIKTTIDTYVNEQTVAFITGKRPLSDWDNYLKELENMQLQTYIDINQAAYDRF